MQHYAFITAYCSGILTAAAAAAQTTPAEATPAVATVAVYATSCRLPITTSSGKGVINQQSSGGAHLSASSVLAWQCLS